uniref:Uncharacterized protein n=1 Tax=Anguilla anguilla TaxID=7936 RepID=A0A0E9Q971_ANGAN
MLCVQSCPSVGFSESAHSSPISLSYGTAAHWILYIIELSGLLYGKTPGQGSWF